jgi:hypothetical protein
MGAKSKRGGAGRGQGRKRNPLKELRVGALIADKILRELKYEAEIIRIFRECGDNPLKVHILFKLHEWAFGKPTQPIDHGGGGPIKVEITTNVKMADPHDS